MPRKENIDTYPYWDLLFLMAQYRKNDFFGDTDPNINKPALKHAIRTLKLRKGSKKYERTLEEARRINPKVFE